MGITQYWGKGGGEALWLFYVEIFFIISRMCWDRCFCHCSFPPFHFLSPVLPSSFLFFLMPSCTPSCHPSFLLFHLLPWSTNWSQRPEMKVVKLSLFGLFVVASSSPSPLPSNCVSRIPSFLAWPHSCFNQIKILFYLILPLKGSLRFHL